MMLRRAALNGASVVALDRTATWITQAGDGYAADLEVRSPSADDLSPMGSRVAKSNEVSHCSPFLVLGRCAVAL